MDNDLVTRACAHVVFGEKHSFYTRTLDPAVYCSNECAACDSLPDDATYDDMCMECYVACK